MSERRALPPTPGQTDESPRQERGTWYVGPGIQPGPWGQACHDDVTAGHSLSPNPTTNLVGVQRESPVCPISVVFCPFVSR